MATILIVLSVSVSVTGKMSWGHITPVRMVGRLTEFLNVGLNYFEMSLVIYLRQCLGADNFIL